MNGIGIIGLGKVGTNLAFNFLKRGATVYAHSNREISQSTLEKIKSIQLKTACDVVKNSHFIFLSVKDSEIKTTFYDILPCLDSTKTVIILSGAFDLKEIKNGKNIIVIRMHPVRAFVDNDFSDIEGTLFVVEGDSKEVLDIVSFLGCKASYMKEFTPLYHASLTFASNFLVTLFNISKELLEQAQIEESFEVIYNLMEITLKNIKENSEVFALTGPIERNDIETVKKHIESIQDELTREIYILLSLKTVEVAKKKNPCNNYSDLTNFLKELLWKKK
ncbi:MAG: DUF2520 domain-containing protein [Caldisericaceae bacterium]